MSGTIMKTIGIIGAGAAGLCSARHALAAGGMTPVVWEQSSRVGGTWVYTPETGKDKYGLPIHSSMYKNLKTNLPKEVMAFPDYPFPQQEESFLPHAEVQKYLENYCDHFGVRPCIKFSHHVERVSPVMKDEGPPAWNVTVKDLETDVSSTTNCDALLVCNGHYSVPRIPNIKDIDSFKGSKSHSHDYRDPHPYKDKTVVVLGAAASGLDVCLEVATVATKVFLSHNQPVEHPSEFPPNVQQVRGVIEAKEDGFVTTNGVQIKADAILYCTGYEFSFPFLTEECGITVENNIVKPLYKHLIHSTYPSMAFVGIPFLVCPFPLFDFQVQYFIATLSGKCKLLSREEMAVHFREEMEQRISEDGIFEKHYHRFGFDIQEKYTEDIVRDVKCSPPKPYIFPMLMTCIRRVILDFPHLKEISYKVYGDTSFEEYRDGRLIHTRLDILWLIVKRGPALIWRDFYRVISLLGSMVLKKFQRIIRLNVK